MTISIEDPVPAFQHSAVRFKAVDDRIPCRIAFILGTCLLIKTVPGLLSGSIPIAARVTCRKCDGVLVGIRSTGFNILFIVIKPKMALLYRSGCGFNKGH